MSYKSLHISTGYKNKIIINDISFDISSPSIVGIIGINGSGKSTLLKALSQQLKHNGETYIDNKKIEDMPIRKLAQTMSYIPQNNTITISLSVLDVVLLGYNARIGIFDKPTLKQRNNAINVLKTLGLQEYIDYEYSSLSEGQKQLVLIARMLVEDTKILLLDEIDSALDFHNRYEILKKIKDIIQTHNKSAIIILHDISLALRYCDTLLILDKGTCTNIVHPSTDDISVLQNGLSSIYKNIKLIPYKESYLTYWED